MVVGLVAHGVSLISSVRNRRRPLELLHGFLVAAMGFLTVAVVAGIGAVALPVDASVRVQLVTAEIAALIGWLGLAVIGHSHKIVPFIVYTKFRSHGVSKRVDGRPLLFTDLYRRTPARLTLVSSVAGFGLLVTGVLTGSVAFVASAGVAIAATAAIATLNLSLTPLFIPKIVNGQTVHPSPPTETRANRAKGLI